MGWHRSKTCELCGPAGTLGREFLFCPLPTHLVYLPPTLSPLLHSVESLGVLSRSQSLGEKHVFGRDPNLKLGKQRLPEESLTPKTEGHKGSSKKKAQFSKGKPCYRVGGIIQ